MASSNPGIQIRKTPVGKGVFAKRQYRKRQVIGQMTGKIIADDNYDPDYVVDLGDLGVLEPAAPFRFLNHCCEPNAALIEYEPETDEPPTMWVETLRAIRPGDQITIDYGWPADSAIACLCGAASCRGWVVAESELAKLKRRLAKAAKSKPESASSRKQAKATASKATASKATASKATASKATASKATASKATASKATASKAAKTPRSAKSAGSRARASRGSV